YLVAVRHYLLFFFFSSRRRHTRSKRDWSSDVCSSDLFTEFLARREQELVAEANSEKRPAAVQRPPEGREESEAFEVRHRVVERPIARKHDGVRAVDGARILGHDRRDAGATERLLDGPEVPPAVIDHGDHGLTGRPSSTGRFPRCGGSPACRRRARGRRPW